MSIAAHPKRATLVETWDHIFRIKGNGAADPVVEFGVGATVKWISTGLYEITWLENPMKYVGLDGVSFEATTASQLAGYTAVAGNYNTSTFKLRISITNSSFALADLTSTQWAIITVVFKETGVNP